MGGGGDVGVIAVAAHQALRIAQKLEGRTKVKVYLKDPELIAKTLVAQEEMDRVKDQWRVYGQQRRTLLQQDKSTKECLELRPVAWQPIVLYTWRKHVAGLQEKGMIHDMSDEDVATLAVFTSSEQNIVDIYAVSKRPEGKSEGKPWTWIMEYGVGAESQHAYMLDNIQELLHRCILIPTAGGGKIMGIGAVNTQETNTQTELRRIASQCGHAIRQGKGKSKGKTEGKAWLPSMGYGGKDADTVMPPAYEAEWDWQSQETSSGRDSKGGGWGFGSPVWGKQAGGRAEGDATPGKGWGHGSDTEQGKIRRTGMAPYDMAGGKGKGKGKGY